MNAIWIDFDEVKAYESYFGGAKEVGEESEGRVKTFASPMVSPSLRIRTIFEIKPSVGVSWRGKNPIEH